MFPRTSGESSGTKRRFGGRFAREKVFSTTRNIVVVFTEKTNDTVVKMPVTRATNSNYDSFVG